MSGSTKLCLGGFRRDRSQSAEHQNPLSHFLNSEDV